jgi:uncharacterized membrane protein HdeD (DUF308 family)
MYREFAYVFLGVSLVVILAFSIVVFIVPPYSSVILFSLLYGGYLLFTGIKKMQKAKAQGEHVSWWKQSLIMSGLAFECFAAIVLWTNLNPNWSNNVFFTSTFVLVSLLSLSLFIYAFILEYQQRIMNRPKQPPGE